MQGQDHTEVTSEHQQPAEQPVDAIQASQMIEQTASTSTPTSGVNAEEPGFDWFAIGVVIIIAALFALLARLNPQPSTSIASAPVQAYLKLHWEVFSWRFFSLSPPSPIPTLSIL